VQGGVAQGVLAFQESDFADQAGPNPLRFRLVDLDTLGRRASLGLDVLSQPVTHCLIEGDEGPTDIFSFVAGSHERERRLARFLGRLINQGWELRFDER
jgi:hypothetical protein